MEARVSSLVRTQNDAGLTALVKELTSVDRDLEKAQSDLTLMHKAFSDAPPELDDFVNRFTEDTVLPHLRERLESFEHVDYLFRYLLYGNLYGVRFAGSPFMFRVCVSPA
jgi:hypothetical protein